MKLPDDVFPTRYDYEAYASTYRVCLFREETRDLPRGLIVACLLKQIDRVNLELAKLKRELAETEVV